MKKHNIRWFIILLLYICFTSTTAAICKTNYNYKFILNDPRDKLHGMNRYIPRCFAFSARSYTTIIDSATITCVNVSTDVTLNHTFQNHFYSQDLIIVNSTIPKFPSNSSVSTFRTVRKLILRNLSIEEVLPNAFNGLEKIHLIDLSRNKLQKIPVSVFDDVSTLRVLYLSENEIKNIDRKSISNLTRLQELYLNGNKISVLQKDVFKDLVSLEILDVSNNPLEEFKDVGFNIVKKLIVKNTYLRQFDVDLSYLKLVYCDFSGNYLQIINFDNFPDMEKVNLSYNHLRLLHNFNKLNIQNVILSHNNLTQLEGLPSTVKELDVSHNQIRILKNATTNWNSSLEDLNLSFNQISEIELGVFWMLHNLKYLKMQHNNLLDLNETTFVNCSKLQSVDLSHNLISYIKPNAFTSTENLNFLDVSHNNLMVLNFTMLYKVNNLKTLYVNNNNLVWFDVETLLHEFINLKEIALNDNSWSCETITDIIHSLNIQNVKIIDGRSLDADNVQGVACRYDKRT